METFSYIHAPSESAKHVRMELFPERDGNVEMRSVSRSAFLVRMELFPERDGNLQLLRTLTLKSTLCPNGALP